MIRKLSCVHASRRPTNDGVIPNRQRWPLIVYKNALRLPEPLDPAAVLEDLFGSHGWGNSWRDGLYDYVHYHSRIHEAVARGSAVRFGGDSGRPLSLKTVTSPSYWREPGANA